MAKECAMCRCKIGLFTGVVNFRDGVVCTKCYSKAGYSTWDSGELASMRSVTIERWKAMNDSKSSGESYEYRMKCNVCGCVYCYTQQDLVNNINNLSTAGLYRISATANALGGTQVGMYGSTAQANYYSGKVTDYSKCPHCNSCDVQEITKDQYEKALKDSKQDTNSSAVSSADEIKKFKELLDSGVITQEEFDAKKKQLLGL